jgi:hypothetical protein
VSDGRQGISVGPKRSLKVSHRVGLRAVAFERVRSRIDWRCSASELWITKPRVSCVGTCFLFDPLLPLTGLVGIAGFVNDTS